MYVYGRIGKHVSEGASKWLTTAAISGMGSFFENQFET